jgi:hypothetical protein
MKTSIKVNGALLLLGLLLTGVVACSDSADVVGPAGTGETVLLDVVPQGGSTNVSRTDPIIVRFNHPVQEHMSQYADLHEGDVDGPVVDGMWTWSNGHRTLTFTPAEPLKPSTMYTIHLGGGMLDHEGSPVNFDRHGPQMGGHWVGEEMFNAGRMGDGPGAGGPAGGMAHMGDGWKHRNGSYGMAFSFTTAAG